MERNSSVNVTTTIPFREGATRHAVWALVSTVFALAQFRMIILVLGAGYANSIDAALGVVEGLPHWRVYQSRVLGPWIVELLSRVFGDFTIAHVFYVIAATTIAGWLILAVMRRLSDDRSSWGAFLLFQFLFSFLLGKMWLYAWDHSGIIIFTLFVYFVLTEKDWRWFTALFAVAIFNRESALFIAVWMVSDPLIKAALDRVRPRLAMPLAGVICGAAGLAIISELRERLLVREIGPDIFHMPEMAGKAFHNQWDANLAFLQRVTSQFSFGFEILIVIFPIVSLIVVFLLARRDPRRCLGLALVQTGIVASMFTAALLEETRVMLELVPIVAVGPWVAFKRERA